MKNLTCFSSFLCSVFPKETKPLVLSEMILLGHCTLSQVDGSVAAKQGVRFVFTDGSRIIFRLSVFVISLSLSTRVEISEF